MQPWPIRSEQNLAGAGAFHRLLQDVEPAHAGGIGENIGMPHEMIDKRGLRPPIVGEAAEVRDDERDVGIFLGQDFRHGNLAHHVIEDGNAVAAPCGADFARDPGVVAMDLDAHEAEFAHRLPHHGIDAALVGQRMNERKTEEAAGIARDDLRQLPVGMKISVGKRGKDHRPVDAGSACAPKVFVERSGGIGRLGQSVALSGMTMAVDDHGASRLKSGETAEAGAGRDRSRDIDHDGVALAPPAAR